MKSYGKRRIPRNVDEFEDLVKPFYYTNDYSGCIQILTSYWKRKGKSNSSAYDISAGIFSCSYYGFLEVDPYFIYVRHGFKASNFVYEHLNAFLPYFYQEFLNEYKSFNGFIDKYYKNINWKFPCHLMQSYYTVEQLSLIAPKELTFNKSWIKWKEHERTEILTDLLIEFDLNKISKIATNKYREKVGLKPEVGHWVQEQYLLDKVSSAFKKLAVIGQGSPSWLDGQRFDIWLPEINLAIEFNGLQHYQAVEHFGGHEGFLKTKERDEMKRQKCKENGVRLLEVREGYHFKEVIEVIKEQIEVSND